MADPVRAIADAVLYEGYVLWPYRRSAMKNAQRWTFGGVYPPGWSAQHPDDRDVVRAEVACEGELEASVRFLQVVRRQVELHGRAVDSAAGYLSWEEAVEREFAVGSGQSADVGSSQLAVAAGSEREEVGDGVAIVRSWHSLQGAVSVDGGVVTVRNTTEFSGGTREEALARSFCSLHAVLRAESFDPSTEARSGDGLWPVLIDERTMLASPIILDDHPEIAPESPGDLFDGGEIDQMLVLNILALTDAEKAEMRATDPRAREILERTESLTQDQLMSLHGRLTDLRQVR
jgi:hypothetical protein